MTRLFMIMTGGLCAIAAFGQQEPAPDLHAVTEEQVAYPDEQAGYQEVYENRVEILSSPHDLNRVTREELEFLHILSDSQIQELLAYRRERGDFVDVHELQTVPGFDVSTITRLLPFVKVADPATRVDGSLIGRIFSEGNTYIVSRYERTLQTNKEAGRGTEKDPHMGSADKLYLRFRSAVSGDFSVGFTAEKDAGEKVSFDPKTRPWGFDFTSWHLQLRNKGKVKNIIAGDFQMQFAQGLMLGGAFGLGKGGESIATTRRSNVGFLPYTSINESAYHRGLASTVAISEKMMLSVFYSRARRDATLINDSGTLSASSMQGTGYHRTEAEIAKRKTIVEQNAGLVLQINSKRTEAGLLVNILDFHIPLIRKPAPYNQGGFHGSSNINAGVFVNHTSRNISLFAEAAQSIGAGRAALAGALMSLHKNFEVAILYRNYMRNYHTFYANAFSENSSPQNELGVYWGWKYRWNRRVGINGYVDLFSFPWLGFRRYAPSDGHEWLVRVTYQPSKMVLLSGQFREEMKQRNLSRMTSVYKTTIGIKSNGALTCDYGVGGNLRLRSRIQYSTYEHEYTRAGIAVVQDLIVSAGVFKFTGRHALFDSDHDNRHYVYESDTWLSYSLPAYSGVGVRNYALIEITIHKNLTVWLRYARTRFIKEPEMTNTVEYSDENIRNDIKFQARYSF